MESETAQAQPDVQLAVVRKGENPQLYRLEPEPLVLGRSAGADLPLADEQVAPQHALLAPAAGGWQVTALGGDTYLADELLPAEVVVAWPADQTLRIGPFFLRWRPLAGAASAGPAAEPVPDSPPPVSERPAEAAAARPTAPQIGISVEPAHVVLAPGEQATVEISLNNPGERVDHFTLNLTGLPREWVSTSHEFVRLAPGGQVSLPVTIHPPEDPHTAPGDHGYRLTVTSSVQETEAATVEGVVQIPEILDFTAALHPERWRHGEPGRVVVGNRGNAAVRLIVGGHDPSGEIVFDRRQALAVAPGAREAVTLVAQAEERPLLVRERILPFTVHLHAEQAAERELAGELAVPPRLSLGCLLLAALPLVALLVVFAGISLGLIAADIPGLGRAPAERGPLRPYIREQWQQGLEITNFVAADGVWLVVMSDTETNARQTWQARASFPGDFVRRQWEAGWAITDLAFGNGRWLLVMAEETAPVTQSWRQASTFPEDFIEERRAAGYAISDLAYGSGVWVVVMTRGEGEREQRWQRASAFPRAFIEEQAAQGFVASEIAYGEGSWAVVTTRAEEGTRQVWQTAATFPGAFVEQQWQAGYDIGEVARGGETWVLFMTRRPDEERRQIWQAANKLR